MAMLDKEVAEEKAELAQTELEEIKEKLAVLEVGNGLLKAGGGTGESSDDAVKSSMAYIQLEKHNERLKEALIKLRDLSQETEQEQRRRLLKWKRTLLGLTNSNVSCFPRCHSQRLSYGAAQYEESLINCPMWQLKSKT